MDRTAETGTRRIEQWAIDIRTPRKVEDDVVYEVTLVCRATGFPDWDRMDEAAWTELCRLVQAWITTHEHEIVDVCLREEIRGFDEDGKG